jgi:cyclopropane-fatty-acyl-phospholipid synthase
MEEIIKIGSKAKGSWLNTKYRETVFKVLSTIENNPIAIHEGNDVTHFGMSDGVDESQIAHISIHDPSVYFDFIRGGSIGAAEAFIDNKWSSSNLVQVIRAFAKARDNIISLNRYSTVVNKIKRTLFHWANKNTVSGSKKNILAHYDLGNELYTRFLDNSMMYSSAIYPTVDATLEEAQENKLKLICERLELNQNDHLLEIGTGWGGLAIYAAKHYGCKVTTTTISDNQFEFACERVKQQGLQDKITLLKQDYRTLEGQYDKLVSIEMIEAVGKEFMQEYFKVCNRLLKKDGKFLIQAITIADQHMDYYENNVDFIQRYIFPGGFLPSINLISEHVAKDTQMVIHEIADIGIDYAQTLKDWRIRFEASWSELSKLGFDEQFKRLWIYYLAYCEGGFRERSISTVQLCLRKSSM